MLRRRVLMMMVSLSLWRLTLLLLLLLSLLLRLVLLVKMLVMLVLHHWGRPGRRGRRRRRPVRESPGGRQGDRHHDGRRRLGVGRRRRGSQHHHVRVRLGRQREHGHRRTAACRDGEKQTVRQNSPDNTTHQWRLPL